MPMIPGFTWLWYSDPVQKSNNDSYVHYTAVKRTGSDGSIRIFNVGDAVITCDTDCTSMFAHVVDMYSKPSGTDEDSDSPTTETAQSTNRFVVLRWFYDVDDVPNYKLPKGHLLFSDHVEPDETNYLHVMFGKVWLFQSPAEAKAFLAEPSKEYDPEEDEVRTVSRYLNISDPALKSTRALRPKELKFLLANPSRDTLFSNPFLSTSPSSSSEQEDRPANAAKRTRSKRLKTERRLRPKDENVLDEGEQIDEDSSSSASFREPNSNSESEADSSASVDKPRASRKGKRPPPRRTRSRHKTRKSSSKPKSVPSSPTLPSPVDQLSPSVHPAPPSNQSVRLRRLSRRDGHFDRNSDDLSFPSLPDSWTEPLLDEDEISPTAQPTTSIIHGKRSSKKRSRASLETEPVSKSGPQSISEPQLTSEPISFSFVAPQTVSAPNPWTISQPHTYHHVSHTTIRNENSDFVPDRPAKRHRSAFHQAPLPWPGIESMPASAPRSISHAVESTPFSSNTDGVLTFSAPISNEKAASLCANQTIMPNPPSLQFPVHAGPSCSPVPREQDGNWISDLPGQGDSVAETMMHQELRRTDTGSVFQPSERRRTSAQVKKAPSIAFPSVGPSSKSSYLHTPSVKSSFVVLEETPINTRATPYRATAVPVVNLRAIPRGVYTSADTLNGNCDAVPVKRRRRLRKPAFPQVKAEPQINDSQPLEPSRLITNATAFQKETEMNLPNGSRSQDFPLTTEQVMHSTAIDYVYNEPVSLSAVTAGATLAAAVKEESDVILSEINGETEPGYVTETVRAVSTDHQLVQDDQFFPGMETVGENHKDGKGPSKDQKDISPENTAVTVPDSAVLYDSITDDHECGLFGMSARENGIEEGDDERMKGKQHVAVSNGKFVGENIETQVENSSHAIFLELNYWVRENSELAELVQRLLAMYLGLTKRQRDMLDRLWNPFLHHVKFVLARNSDNVDSSPMSDDRADQIVGETLLEMESIGFDFDSLGSKQTYPGQ